MTPASVATLPLVSNVPPPALSVTARFELKPARYCSVPPLKLSPPAAAPRLPSDEIASVPPLIAQGVTAAVVPVKVQVLVPVFWKMPKP